MEVTENSKIVGQNMWTHIRRKYVSIQHWCALSMVIEWRKQHNFWLWMSSGYCHIQLTAIRRRYISIYRDWHIKPVMINIGEGYQVTSPCSERKEIQPFKVSSKNVQIRVRKTSCVLLWKLGGNKPLSMVQLWIHFYNKPSIQLDWLT